MFCFPCIVERTDLGYMFGFTQTTVFRSQDHLAAKAHIHSGFDLTVLIVSSLKGCSWLRSEFK
ncbi:hypothetical protein SBA5_670017 [Candidatus Sulfotelmatomonas gaucii]|uniref:Uncharacterized protein n=1 Tax=Candidatus Sulfuritelmatomonas gaucii TaxID=2043161 RepID=A0A2N9LZC9_9BACT|nr:hypothetical protein SBA5_670017 [Candidatus Sulfotelmatomonas gaucii]